MKRNIVDILEENPVIPAVRDEESLKKALLSKSEIIFLLSSDILNFRDRLKEIKDHGKLAFIHMDLINGLNTSPFALEYVYKTGLVDGILSTKKNIILKANTLGLMSILRIFAIDSTTIKGAGKLIKETKPSAVEILPGVAPKATKLLKNETNAPIICGGMVDTMEEIKECLTCGAIGASTSNHKIW